MKTFYSGFMEKGKYKTMLEIEGKGIISGLTIRSEDENALPAKVRVHREGVLIVEIPINEASKDIDPIPFDYSTKIDVLSNMTGRDNLRMDIDYALKHRFQPTIVEPYPDEHWTIRRYKEEGNMEHKWGTCVDNPTIAKCECGFVGTTVEEMVNHVKDSEIAALRYELLAEKTARADADNAIDRLKEELRLADMTVEAWVENYDLLGMDNAALKGETLRLFAGWTEAKEQVRELSDELEQERVRLAGCGVAATQNTNETVKDRLGRGGYGYSASYEMVCDAVDREMQLREALKKIEHKTTSCRIWAGMEWHYHHPAVKNIVDIAREALKGREK